MLVDRRPLGGSENWGKIIYKGSFYTRRLSRKDCEKYHIQSCRRHTDIILYSFLIILSYTRNPAHAYTTYTGPTK